MGMQLPGLSFVERVFDAVDNFLNGSLSQEGSVGGRFESIEAGLGVWVDNPIGIPNDFIHCKVVCVITIIPHFLIVLY